MYINSSLRFKELPSQYTYVFVIIIGWQAIYAPFGQISLYSRYFVVETMQYEI